jgi:hypothetical protein
MTLHKSETCLIAFDILRELYPSLSFCDSWDDFSLFEIDDKTSREVAALADGKTIGTGSRHRRPNGRRFRVCDRGNQVVLKLLNAGGDVSNDREEEPERQYH